MNKKILIITVFLLIIGGAFISANSFVEKSRAHETDYNSFDHDVIFTSVNTDDKSVAEISLDHKRITYTSQVFENIGDSSTMNFEITNKSNQYDAKVSIKCTTDINDYNDYVTISNDKNEYVIEAGNIVSGYIATTLTSYYDNEISFTCEIISEAVKREEVVEDINANSLYNIIRKSSQGLDTSLGINYNRISSSDNGEGVFTTTNTDNSREVYFYRGDVDNNLIYAGFCWKIIRTTETGGIKIIYNGKPNNNSCDNTGGDTTIGNSVWHNVYNDNSYLGYMYGSTNSNSLETSQSNEFETDIKKNVIDPWYKKNIEESGFQDMLEDTIFCNDRSVLTDKSNLNYSGALSYGNLGYSKNKTFYAAAGRVWQATVNTNPTLKCNQLNDRYTVKEENGNGALTYPIGLVTLDEVIYAGATGGKDSKGDSANNKKFYLYNGSYYWTMSPIRFNGTNAIIGVVYPEGDIQGYYAGNNKVGVRPVVSLKNSTQIKEGTGTSLDPYII